MQSRREDGLRCRQGIKPPPGFPAGFHLLGGGGELKDFGGGSSLGVGGLRVIKNKVSKNFGGSN